MEYAANPQVVAVGAGGMHAVGKHTDPHPGVGVDEHVRAGEAVVAEALVVGELAGQEAIRVYIVRLR